MQPYPRVSEAAPHTSPVPPLRSPVILHYANQDLLKIKAENDESESTELKPIQQTSEEVQESQQHHSGLQGQTITNSFVDRTLQKVQRLNVIQSLSRVRRGLPAHQYSAGGSNDPDGPRARVVEADVGAFNAQSPRRLSASMLAEMVQQGVRCSSV